MPLVLADRVKETTTTTGTGTITLAGAVTGFSSFAVIGNGNTTYYTIAGQGTSEWEVGIGTYTASGTTLSRDTVLASSAGAPTKTNFSAGTKDVFVTYTAARSVNVDGTSIDTFGLGAAQGDILYAAGTDNFVLLNKNTTATRYLANTGTTNNPQWDQVNLANGVTGTLPVGNAGTGRSSVTSGNILLGAGTSAMTELAGSSPGQAVIWSGTAWTAGTVSGGGGYIFRNYSSPNTWSKPAGLKSVKVTVVGGGGNGGAATSSTPGAVSNGGSGGSGGGAILYIDAPAIPGPVGVTAGAGANSFGAFVSATGGSNGAAASGGGTGAAGAGGTGSGGNMNIPGSPGAFGLRGAPAVFGFGFGAASAGVAGGGFGSGGGGAARGLPVGTTPGGAGAPGIVIVEEFY